MDPHAGEQESSSLSDHDQQNHVGAGEEKRTIKQEEEGREMGKSKPEEAGVEVEQQDTHDPSKYPGTAQLVAIILAAGLSFFLVALDITIVSTAIPAITAEFQSLEDVAWYGRLSERELVTQALMR